MLINNGNGTFAMGPADVICVFRLPTGRHHVAILEENPMPGPMGPIDELSIIRLKSKGHHTTGAETLEGAQHHIAEFRQKLIVDDANVVADVAFDIDDPVCILHARNWIKEKMPLKEALGLPAVA